MRRLGANLRECDDGSYGGGRGGGAGCAQPLGVPALVDLVRSNHLPHSVVVNCSTADGVTGVRASWLSRAVNEVGEWVTGGGVEAVGYHFLCVWGSVFCLAFLTFW